MEQPCQPTRSMAAKPPPIARPMIRTTAPRSASSLAKNRARRATMRLFTAPEGVAKHGSNDHTNIVVGRNSMIYGTIKPPDAVHHLYDTCHESACDTSDFQVDAILAALQASTTPRSHCTQPANTTAGTNGTRSSTPLSLRPTKARPGIGSSGRMATGSGVGSHRGAAG